MFDRARIIAERDAARRDVTLLRARLRAVEQGMSERDRIVRDLCSARLIVFLREGGIFDGLLVDADKRTMTFADVRRRGADGVSSTNAAPGLLHIDRDQVHYLQQVYADQPRGE